MFSRDTREYPIRAVDTKARNFAGWYLIHCLSGNTWILIKKKRRIEMEGIEKKEQRRNCCPGWWRYSIGEGVSRSNGRENTCYRQVALFFCCLVRGEGGIKQREWIKKRRKREKRSTMGEGKANWNFCWLYNKIPKRFHKRQKQRKGRGRREKDAKWQIKTDGAKE